MGCIILWCSRIDQLPWAAVNLRLYPRGYQWASLPAFLYCRTTTIVLLNSFRCKFSTWKVLKFYTRGEGEENAWHKLQLGLKLENEELSPKTALLTAASWLLQIQLYILLWDICTSFLLAMQGKWVSYGTVNCNTYGRQHFTLRVTWSFLI